MSTQIKYKDKVITTFEKGTITLHTTDDKLSGDIEVMSDGASECSGEHVIRVDELPDKALYDATYRLEESKLSDILLSSDGNQISLQYLLLVSGADSLRIHNVYSFEEIEAPSVGDICYIIPEGVVYFWEEDKGVWTIMPDHITFVDDTPVTTGFITSIGTYQNTGSQEYILCEYTEYFSGEKSTVLQLARDVRYDYKPYYILMYDGQPVERYSGEYTGEYTQEQTRDGLLSLLKSVVGYTDEQLARCDVHIYEPVGFTRVNISEATLTSFGDVSITYGVGLVDGELFDEYVLAGTYTKAENNFTFAYTNLPEDALLRYVAENLLATAKYGYYSQYGSWVNTLTFGDGDNLTLVTPGVITSTGSFEPSNTGEYVLCEYTEYFSGDTVLSLQRQSDIHYDYKPYYVFVSENGIFHYDYSGEYTGEKERETIKAEILAEVQERYMYTDENIARCQVLFYDPVQFVRVKIYEVSVNVDGLISITYSAGPVEGDLSDNYVLTGKHSRSANDIVFRYDNIPDDEYLRCVLEKLLLSAKFESYAYEDHIIFGDGYRFTLNTYVETNTETRIDLVNETYIDRSYNEWYEKSFLDLILVEDGHRVSTKDLAQVEGAVVWFYIIPTKTINGIHISDDNNMHCYYIEDENDIFVYDGETWISIKDGNPDMQFNGFITSKKDAVLPGYYALGDTPGWKKYISPSGSKTLKKSGLYDVAQYTNVIVDVTSETLAGKWWFSDSLNLPNSSIKYDIKFTYNYQNSVTSTSNYIQYGYDGNGYELRSDDMVLYHSLDHNGWAYGYSRIFDFGTEPQFVTPEFKEWITSNAIAVGTSRDDNKITLFDEVVYFNNMNGKEYSTIDVAKYEYDVSTQNSTKLNDFVEHGQWAEASTLRLMDDSTKLRRGIYLQYSSQGVYNGFGDIQSLTIGGWFKPMPAELDFERFLWCGGASLFGIWRGKNNIIMCDAGGNAYSSDYKIVDNLWTHLAMSLDSVDDNTTITIYVNGEIIYEKTVTYPLDLHTVAIGMAGDYCANAYTKNTFATKCALTHEKIRRIMLND